jgi:site-specific recombinase XerD
MVVNYRQHAYANNTNKSYTTHFKCYVKLCDMTGISPIPISSVNVCRYAAYLAGVKQLSASSVPKYLNIIRILHK